MSVGLKSASAINNPYKFSKTHVHSERETVQMQLARTRCSFATAEHNHNRCHTNWKMAWNMSFEQRKWIHKWKILHIYIICCKLMYTSASSRRSVSCCEI